MTDKDTMPTPSWPGYTVTQDGRVFSEWSNWRGYGKREMRQQINSCGYPSVRLIGTDGKRRRITVHRLVADAFLPPKPSPDHEIRHLDGSKDNNYVENLAWGTRSDNAKDRVRHGRQNMPRWEDPEYRLRQLIAIRRGNARVRAARAVGGENRHAK